MSASSSILPIASTVAPTEPSEVEAAVREAYESGTPVYPIGGGTQLGYGVRPSAPGVGLHLAGLNRVIDYADRDLTITVEAGLTMAALAERLAAQGQRLPVDVPQADRATVGGVVAANPIGPRRFRWGTVRDYLLGLRAVDGRGQVFSGGGRVVKNAAGYGLCRLLTGSLGTLGVITQVTLMVKPMPEASALLACDVPEWDAAERLLSALVHTKTQPAAVELLAGPHWAADAALRPAPQKSVARLAVGLEGTRAELDWMIGQLLAELRQAGGGAPQTVADAGAWQRLIEFPRGDAERNRNAPLVLQMGVLPGDVVPLVRLLVQLCRECSVQAHAGSGAIQVRFPASGVHGPAAIDPRVGTAVAEAGGSMVVLSHPGRDGWDRQAVWGPPGPAARVMQAVKDQLDPKGILNAGRYVFASR